jgi:N-acetylneuraminic acid mutarotase
MGIAKPWGYLHFNFVVGASFQHEGVTKTWSIVIQVSSHHDWSIVCNTFSHCFAIMMINI